MAIQVEVWGDYACFTRPEMKTERVSYDCMTPSAARGMLESLFWHPGLKWVIDRIHVCAPIRFTNIRRNEVKDTIPWRKIERAMQTGQGDDLYLVTSKSIQQRAAMVLTNVRYVIDAHFVMTDNAAPGDNPGKFQDIVKRRLRKGACYAAPYLGTRECTAHFRLWEGESIEGIDETRDLGYMLYDMDFSDPEHIQPMFFHAKMEHGCIDLRGCEVIK